MASPFYETYRFLCQKIGKSDNAVAAEIGLSNSTVTTWRQGAAPRRPTIKKVADYFGVTINQMMGYEPLEEQKEKPAQEGELDEETKELRKIWDDSDPDERQALLEMARLIKKRRLK